MNYEAIPQTLGEAQRLFAALVGEFLVDIYSSGYQATFGEVWRSAEEAAILANTGAGVAKSLHTDRLAIDLNVFKDGAWLQSVADLATVGAMWKAKHPLCRWGGDFRTRPDSDHYSLTWGGIQ